MKLDIIFMIITGIFVIYYFMNSSCNNTEHFDAASDAAEAAVKKVYQADVGAIRTLADVATKLQTGGYTCPGDYTINGSLTFPGGNTLNSNGRFHISGAELLYLLNKSGVIIGKEWGGNGNLNVQGTLNMGDIINSPNLNRLGAVNSEWLRINDAGSVGQTALYGALAINDTRGNAGGLCVGDWRTNVGQGNIHATGNITAGGTINAGGIVNFPRGWRIHVDDGGHFRIQKDGADKFVVHNDHYPVWAPNGMDAGSWIGTGGGTINASGNIKTNAVHFNGSGWNLRPGWSNEFHFRSSDGPNWGHFYAIYPGRTQGL